MENQYLKKIIAQSPEDLNVISACCSEGRVNIKDVKYLASNKIFLMSISRLNKDSEEHVIIDWKTSKRIDKKSFKGKTGIKKETSDIEDCNYNHYALQLSLYRFILEEYYNIQVSRQLIAHLKEDGLESHSTPYMKKEILDMMV